MTHALTAVISRPLRTTGACPGRGHRLPAAGQFFSGAHRIRRPRKAVSRPAGSSLTGGQLGGAAGVTTAAAGHRI